MNEKEFFEQKANAFKKDCQEKVLNALKEKYSLVKWQNITVFSN